MILSTFLVLKAAAKPFSSASIWAWSLGPAGFAAAGFAAGAAPGAAAGGVAAFAAPPTTTAAANVAANPHRLCIVRPPQGSRQMSGRGGSLGASAGLGQRRRLRLNRAPIGDRPRAPATLDTAGRRARC